jgi:hypothetical protein
MFCGVNRRGRGVKLASGQPGNERRIRWHGLHFPVGTQAQLVYSPPAIGPTEDDESRSGPRRTSYGAAPAWWRPKISQKSLGYLLGWINFSTHVNRTRSIMTDSNKTKTMKRNTKILLLAGLAFLMLLAIIAGVIMALKPFFNVANVVSGGQ